MAPFTCREFIAELQKAIAELQKQVAADHKSLTDLLTDTTIVRKKVKRL